LEDAEGIFFYMSFPEASFIKIEHTHFLDFQTLIHQSMGWEYGHSVAKLQGSSHGLTMKCSP
jgi:hypothetical protein